MEVQIGGEMRVTAKEMETKISLTKISLFPLDWLNNLTITDVRLFYCRIARCEIPVVSQTTVG